MFAPSWLRSLSARRPRPAAPARRPSFRPRVEGLEDRAVPAALGFSSALYGEAYGMAVDAAGDTYVTTITAANGSTRAVYKFDPAGHLLASNPSVPAGGAGLALDAAGNVYLQRKGVVTELDPTLQNTLFTVTLPGVSIGRGGFAGGTAALGSIAVAGGKIYVAGAAGIGLAGANAGGLPTTPTAFQPAWPGAATGSISAYLAVIDPASSAPYHLSYCTYLGGAGPDSATGVAVDAAGAVYLTGTAASRNFPTTLGAFQTANKSRNWTSFVAKMDPSQPGAGSLAYSTYLGGSNTDGYVRNTAGYAATNESGPSIAVDGAGHAYVAGSTTSPDFPTTAGAFQRTYVPVKTPYASPNTYTVVGHAYVTEVNPAGTGLVYSTFLGGSQMDGAGGIALDAAGHAWVTGWTRSSDFPTVNPLQPTKAAGTDPQVSYQTNSDAFVAELDTTGGLLFSTFWGGAGNDYGMGIAVDGFGDVIVVGVAGAGFPTTAGAYQTSGTGFILKIKH